MSTYKEDITAEQQKATSMTARVAQDFAAKYIGYRSKAVVIMALDREIVANQQRHFTEFTETTVREDDKADNRQPSVL